MLGEILRLIASCGDDIIDAPQTELHEAVDLDEPTRPRHDIQSIVTMYPWTIDQWNREGRSPLALAAHNGNLYAARELVRLGSNIHQSDYNGVTPLMMASSNGHADVVRYLLDAGCLVNAASTYGKTALHFAANPEIEPAEDPEAIVQILLSAGASVNEQGPRGTTALHHMGFNVYGRLTRRAAVARIRLLLEAGADINAMSHDRTARPLSGAICFDQPEVAKCLIEFGAQVTDLFQGENLLHATAQIAQLELLQCLIDMKLPLMNVYQEDDWGTHLETTLSALCTPQNGTWVLVEGLLLKSKLHLLRYTRNFEIEAWNLTSADYSASASISKMVFTTEL